jgi:hypothetical protein
MVALTNIIYEPWGILGYERPQFVRPIDTSAVIPPRPVCTARPSATAGAGSANDPPRSGGVVIALVPGGVVIAPALGAQEADTAEMYDQDAQHASTFLDLPPGQDEEDVEVPLASDPPSEPKKSCFGGRAGADLLRQTTRWNRITTYQIRTIGSKGIAGHQEFTTSEDVPDASTLCKAVVLEMPAEPKTGPHSLVLPGQHVWAFFDSAMAIIHLDHARMVSGKDNKTGMYWIGIEFPIQDIITIPADTKRRPGAKAELRNTALRAYSHMYGPYGTRFTDLMGHVT